jgi:predicted transcriptional regulator
VIRSEEKDACHSAKDIRPHERDLFLVVIGKIKRKREELGISTYKLADAIGIPEPRIREIEGGDFDTNFITAYLLYRMARVVGVTLAEIENAIDFRLSRDRK